MSVRMGEGFPLRDLTFPAPVLSKFPKPPLPSADPHYQGRSPSELQTEVASSSGQQNKKRAPPRPRIRIIQADQESLPPPPSARSHKSFASSTTTIRSFHRPFYASDPQWRPDSRESTFSTNDEPVSPVSPTSPNTLQTQSRRDSVSTVSSLGSSATPPSPILATSYFNSSEPTFQKEIGPDFYTSAKIAALTRAEWQARLRQGPTNSPALGTILGASTSECPDQATIIGVQDHEVFDKHGRSVPFSTLYTGGPRRRLVIFVRHFHCGACQRYLRALSQQLPANAPIAVLGCGRSGVIRYYAQTTNCPWPIYADPTRQIFRKLGMAATLKIGAFHSPEYLKGLSTPVMLCEPAVKVTKAYFEEEGLGGWDCVKGGNIFQIGGEFLFEDGRVVWCYRMRNWKGHSDVGLMKRLLQING